MTSQDYIKVGHVRTWLLSSNFAKYQQFWSECFFSSFVSLILALYNDRIQLLFLVAVCSAGLFALGKKFILFFFRWNLQTIFFEKLMFSKDSTSFVLLVFNDGALNLHLHVVALLASLKLSWPAKTTKKLNMSGLDFLVLVLQSPNSFFLNTFFSSFFSLILALYKGRIQLLFLGAVCSTVFLKGRK